MMRRVHMSDLGTRRRDLLRRDDHDVVALGERGVIGPLGFPFVVRSAGENDLGNAHEGSEGRAQWAGRRILDRTFLRPALCPLRPCIMNNLRP